MTKRTKQDIINNVQAALDKHNIHTAGRYIAQPQLLEMLSTIYNGRCGFNILWRYDHNTNANPPALDVIILHTPTNRQPITELPDKTWNDIMHCADIINPEQGLEDTIDFWVLATINGYATPEDTPEDIRDTVEQLVELHTTGPT